MKAPKEKDNPIEIFHYVVCKHILGVQKQTTNIGVLLELGRVPLQNYAIKSAIKNWERIERGKINTVLLKSHHDAIYNGLPWITNIKSILQSYELDTIHRDEAPRRNHPFIHKILHEKQCDKYHNDAFNTIKDPDSKLRTYALFKTDIGREKYLDEIKNFAIRQSLTKFRLSNNLLNIEKMRHTTPITPKEERFCPFCPRVVEDEEHFLLGCPVNTQPRKELIKKVVIKNPHFTHKSVAQKFAELMTPQNAQFVAKTVLHF